MNLLRTTCRAAAASILLLSTPAGADEGKVIPLSDEIRKDLALLGEGVVGKALPAPIVTDVAQYRNLGGGTWEFQIVAGNDKGKTQRESYENESGDRWVRHIGDEYLEYLDAGVAGGHAKVAEAALGFGYRSTFAPGIHEAKNFAPGESVDIDSKLSVSEEKNPDEVKYTGTMKATVSNEGAYEVTVLAGTIATVLMKNDVKIHVGPAKVEDTQYTFFAKGVGKVAEIEAQRIAAVLIYHSHSDTAKVLTSYPKR
jgi:hypothetical protein